MASRSFKQIIGALSLVEGCALFVQAAYRQRPRHKTVDAICERVKRSCAVAHKAWPQQVTLAEADKMSKLFAEVERAAFSGSERESIVAYCSLALGLLSDVLDKIKDPEKRRALGEVNSALCALNAYFDRNLDSWDDYDRANRAVNIWQERMA